MVVFKTIIFIKLIVSLTIVNNNLLLTIVNEEENRPEGHLRKYQKVLANPQQFNFM